ncbi:hypothetical protein ACGFNU_18825 [Spirillospora sp. NPDC048911]|uniref:hypothetical protein n=1 Tax=Spirillospora sp. NPDC048911 TaxID=3364527 RepID=UPI003713C9E0
MTLRRRVVPTAVMSVVLGAVLTLSAGAATSWTVVGSPNRGTWVNALSDASATSAGNVWTVGNWYDVNLASTRTLALRWNGSQWSSVTTPNVNNFYNELYGVDATSVNDAWAVGAFATGQSGGGNGNNGPHNTLAMHWNGSTWSRVATPNPGIQGRDLYDVEAFSTTNAWAVGYYLESGTTYETLVLHWNGTAWSQVDSPNPANYYNQLHGVSGSGPNDIWAVGAFVDRGQPNGTRHPLAMHWNGSAWTQSDVPASGNAILYSVTTISPTDAWAVGSKDGYRKPVAYHWNGSAWSEMPTPMVGTSGNNLFYAVTALGADKVWAVGYTSTSGGPQPLVERWDGTAWRVETTPAPELGGLTQGIAAVPGTAPVVWAVGYKNVLVNGSMSNRTLTLRGLTR